MTRDNELSNLQTTETNPRERNDILFEYDERINASSDKEEFISKCEVNCREGNEVMSGANGTKRMKEIKCDDGAYDARDNTEEEVGFEQTTKVQAFQADHLDERSLSFPELQEIVESTKSLSSEQRTELLYTLSKYLKFFTSKPGLCTSFTYKFEVTKPDPIINPSRPIPFSMRPAVDGQIQQMLRDGILEPSHSPFSSPLVVVSRPGKSLRICVDARKINEITVPDNQRTPPIQELIQKFEGVKYMSNLDLTASFLQIPLDDNSRKYTAFLYNSMFLQYCRTPFGFKNSQAGLIRALNQVLGADTHGYVIAYVDDLVIYSNSYEEHIRHVDTVLERLTNAGFTINAKKCTFCQAEITFLGYTISPLGVHSDPRRVSAILSYPPPRNQKQLRQFLGTCNYHHRFIINYAMYVAPLLPLMKKGSKWAWTEQMQKAFELLRQQFAASIHLIHPVEGRQYAIYTDACKFAISGILTQLDDDGSPVIISTASRVLNPAERKYSTCEQELLAIVYSLEKFRIFIYGHKIKIHSDNKALSFLNRCVITSNRISRWILAIQEYDLEIIHIKGTQNYLADILSRNPEPNRRNYEAQGIISRPH
jgi:hypothetical protein